MSLRETPVEVGEEASNTTRNLVDLIHHHDDDDEVIITDYILDVCTRCIKVYSITNINKSTAKIENKEITAHINQCTII